MLIGVHIDTITMASVGTSVVEVKGYFLTLMFANVNGPMIVGGGKPATKIMAAECKYHF